MGDVTEPRTTLAAERPAARAVLGLCLVGLAYLAWQAWGRLQDGSLEGMARQRAAQWYLIGNRTDDAGASAWRDGRASAEFRDGSGNVVRADAVWQESLAVGGQLAGADGTVSVLDGVLDADALPEPRRSAGGARGLSPGDVPGVAFACSARSAAGGATGVLRVRDVSPPAFGTTGADEVEATWTPDGGKPATYRLRRTR